VTASTLVQGQRVKGQGHSVRNRQHGFIAKFVGLSYLFNLKTKNPERLARCRLHNTLIKMYRAFVQFSSLGMKTHMAYCESVSL